MRMSSSSPSSDATRSSRPATCSRFSWICSSRPCTLSVRPASRSRRAVSCRLSSPELGGHGGARRLGRGELDPRLRDRSVDGIQDRRQLRGDSGRDLPLGSTDHGATSGLSGGLPLALALTLELHDPGLARADALLERLDVEAGAHLAVAGGLERRRACPPAPTRRGSAAVPRVRRSSRSSATRAALSASSTAADDLRQRRRETVALRDRRFVAHGRAVDLLGVRGESGVMRAQRRQRRLRALASRLERLDGIRERLAQRIGDDDDLVAAFGGGIPLGRQLEARPTLPRPGPQRVLRCTTSPARVTIVTRPPSSASARAGAGDSRGIEVVGDDDVRQDAEHAVRRDDDLTRRDDSREFRERGTRCMRRPRSRCRRHRGRRRGRCGRRRRRRRASRPARPRRAGPVPPRSPPRSRASP